MDIVTFHDLTDTRKLTAQFDGDIGHHMTRRMAQDCSETLPRLVVDTEAYLLRTEQSYLTQGRSSTTVREDMLRLGPQLCRFFP
jgi:hypothetical protein